MTTPDTRPGFYYVSVKRWNRGDPEYRLLRGPFVTRAEALEALPQARDEAIRADSHGLHYQYGTARCDEDAGPGILDRPRVEFYDHHDAPIGATRQRA